MNFTNGKIMFEHFKEPLASRSIFIKRLSQTASLGLILIVIALGIGMVGYHHFEKMPWIDAFANAAMILSGMGPLAPLQYSSGKIFAGLYALFSGLMFIVIMGIIFSPIIHRTLHKFHVAYDEGGSKHFR
jgi:hypothetical protein